MPRYFVSGCLSHSEKIPEKFKTKSPPLVETYCLPEGWAVVYFVDLWASSYSSRILFNAEEIAVATASVPNSLK